jgi:hypothetical protein
MIKIAARFNPIRRSTLSITLTERAWELTNVDHMINFSQSNIEKNMLKERIFRH